VASHPTNDAIVVGGGVIGLSIAWQAASAGLAVTVVDPSPGRGASWAAAGMLAPVSEAHFGEEPLARLNVIAADRWPAFARSLEDASGHPIGYLPCGTILAAVDASDRRAVDDVFAFQLSIGLEARRLSANECRTLEPLLAPGVRGGVEFRHDHQVDNRRLVQALLAACAAVGVTMVDDTVVAVESTGDRVSGVSLSRGGTLAGHQVVVAAGCRSGQLGGLPATAVPPVRPVKGLTLRLQTPEDGLTLRQTVRGMVHGRSCYLVPRTDGSVVVGATVEEKGFDLSVQVGAVHALLTDARALVPALDEYELIDTTAGLRPGSPDNAPIVGGTVMGGLTVATGHYRNGILLAPATAEAVVALLLGEAMPQFLAPFGIDRFDRSGPGGPAGPASRPASGFPGAEQAG
jgi:glycine oxidase